MTGRFPAVPQIQKGEALASWVARLALANGWEPRELTRALAPSIPYLGWASLPDSALLTTLCECTGVSIEDLAQASLTRELEWFTFLWREDKNKGDWLWPIPHVEKSATSITGICPECLRADPLPYYRKAWRYAFLTHCPIHRAPLLYRCPECGFGWNPFRRTSTYLDHGGVHGLAGCDRCGFHILELPAFQLCTEPPSVQWSLHLQRQLLGVLDGGWFELNDKTQVHGAMFFPGLRTLVRLLGLRHGLELRMWLEHESGLGPFSGDGGIGHFLRFEDLPSAFRTHLLAVIGWLLEEWPGRLLQALDTVGLSNTFVIEHRVRRLPCWLRTVFQEPMALLHHPETPLAGPPTNRNMGSPAANRTNELANHYEALTFVEDHPEWREDRSQLIQAMKDMRVVAPRRSTKSISAFCDGLERLLDQHDRHKQRIKDPLTLQSYRARQAQGRKFLKALKGYLRRRLGV